MGMGAVLVAALAQNAIKNWDLKDTILSQTHNCFSLDLLPLLPAALLLCGVGGRVGGLALGLVVEAVEAEARPLPLPPSAEAAACFLALLLFFPIVMAAEG